MKARKLRSKVTIQQVTRTTNTHGEGIEAWSTYKVEWATINPMSGREYFTANQDQADVTHRFFFRYTNELAAINPQNYRIQYNGDTYDIISPPLNIKMMNREIELMAKVHNG